MNTLTLSCLEIFVPMFSESIIPLNLKEICWFGSPGNHTFFIGFFFQNMFWSLGYYQNNEGLLVCTGING